MTDQIKQVAGDLQKQIRGLGSEFNTSNID